MALFKRLIISSILGLGVGAAVWYLLTRAENGWPKELALKIDNALTYLQSLEQTHWILEKLKWNLDWSEVITRAGLSAGLGTLTAFVLLSLLSLLCNFFADLKSFFPLTSGLPSAK